MTADQAWRSHVAPQRRASDTTTTADLEEWLSSAARESVAGIRDRAYANGLGRIVAEELLRAGVTA